MGRILVGLSIAAIFGLCSGGVILTREERPTSEVPVIDVEIAAASSEQTTTPINVELRPHVHAKQDRIDLTPAEEPKSEPSKRDFDWDDLHKFGGFGHGFGGYGMGGFGGMHMNPMMGFGYPMFGGFGHGSFEHFGK
ncbi:hypothetical protein RvY_07351 [Ramazzottius varieornatus]|uniref:Uncharacterized protein n=1 Tax=Ramazzottius varieornatus TaxID=947166 RepID=A0A1D1V1T8_RAMVA|nr:hypothetical protein RvY_07351 [Ramazzottius varieornatus]